MDYGYRSAIFLNHHPTGFDNANEEEVMLFF